MDGVAMETDVGDSWSVPSWKRNVTPTRVCERDGGSGHVDVLTFESALTSALRSHVCACVSRGRY